ncbi:MAG: NUDIX hydrolase [Acidobacteriota bacterium]|nr:MAG: NUDIX hydrolase [Acidobacteriota bacterium]
MLMDAVGKVWRMLSPRTRARVTRSVQPKFTVSSAAIVRNDEGKILLLDHYFRPDKGWGLPGGFVEYGETPEQAACREVMEESGVEIYDLKLLRQRTVGSHLEISFTAKGRGDGAIGSKEIRGIGWFTAGELPDGISEDLRSLIISTENLI